MKEGHIFIQGIISPWQDDEPGKYGEVNIKQVTQQIQDNADAEKLIVHIHSPGGDVTEGFGMHDILKFSGKEIETRIEGLCASAATIVAMAGSTRQMTENSDFMIHNPWGMEMGDADEMQKYADMLKSAEDKIIDFYVDITGADRELIKSKMTDETWLTAEEAKSMGFITEIITEIKAVAKYNFKKPITMNKTELEKTIDNKFDAFLLKIKGLFKGRTIKALTVTTADDVKLDFGDQVETVEEIAVGMTATIEGGGVPDGDYTMPDGGMFVFETGTLTEIKEPESDDDVDALKQKIATLEAENEELKSQNTANDSALDDIKVEITNLKAQIKSDLSTFDPEAHKTDPPGDKVRSPGKVKTGI